jgi:integrase
MPRIGGVRLDALSAADLTTMYRELLATGGRGGRPLAPKTVRHVHTTLRKALSDAVEAKHLAWNPATAAKAPKIERTKEPDHWNAEQVRSFLASVGDDRLEALWILALTSGLRRGEILGLRWSDINLDGAKLQVRQTRVAYGKLHVTKEPKTARSRRQIPLSPVAVEALQAHGTRQKRAKLAAGPAYADGGLVFADEIGDPLDPPTVSATFGRLVRAARLPRITLHGARHSFATVALEAGVDVLYVSELLGHSSPAITQSVYQHVRTERLEGAVQAVSDAIRG